MGIDHGGREDFAHGHGDGVSRRMRKRSHRGGLALSGGCGLRTSHLEALRTRRVIELSGRAAPSITEFSDVALVDAISRDLDAARAFVAAQLGDLARDDAKERGERAALLAVLDAQGSLTAAARTLGIHKNTVLQRVRRAEERRGRPATVKIAELHAALLVCDVLGASVLPES
jgi:DNA-binding PucR family transcriptional regulator